MNKISKAFFSLAVTSLFGVAVLSAQSCAATGHGSRASDHISAASSEASAATGDSVAGSAQVVSALGAVPVWMSGAVIGGSGEVLAASGNAMTEGGTAATKGAEQLWDFASGDPAKRPALDRGKALPPATQAPARTRDPSPAEALKTKI